MKAIAGRFGGSALLVLALACHGVSERTFATPEQAVQRLAEVLGTGRAAEELLGPGSSELIASGDAQADRADALRVKAMIAERVELEDYGENAKIAFLGRDEWPLPFPLVNESGRWHFDLEGGRQELLNRRIGRNELLALETLHAIVDAQREYRALPREGPARYADKFRSTEGLRDGLYWPVAQGEIESPLGLFVAEASAEERRGGEPLEPFRGYFFRILTRQSASAPGGERSYLDAESRLTGGFAVLAWPARYDNSGVMTFQVSHQGIVFEKDLGPETESAAARISAYAPDETWIPTSD
jgi:hypothetical protein